MKGFIGLTIIALMLIGGGSSNAIASGNHHNDSETTINNTTLILPTTYVQQTFESGKALAVSAARCGFGDAGRALQVCLGAGRYKDTNALTIGAGQVIGDILWNGTISKEESDSDFAYGFGILWHFRE